MANGRPSEEQVGLSNALIGGAFGFIGIAIFASASYADKVSRGWLIFGNWVTVAAVVSLIVSIICGGKGIFKPGTGPSNMFNRQALAGLVGVLLLLAASAIFAFNPKNEQPASVSVPVFETRIHRVEAEQQALAADMRTLKLQRQQAAPLQTASPTKNANTAAPSGE